MRVENFSKFIKYFGQGRRIKLFGFFILSIIAGSLELLGIALVYPFILLLLKPEYIVNSSYYKDFAKFLFIPNTLTGAFIIGLIVAILFILKNLFIIYANFCQNKFISNWKIDIANRFMKYYLFAPYKKTLETSPSEKIYKLTYLIGQSLDGFIFRIINLCTNSVIVVMILGLLVWKFPSAAILTGIFITITMIIHNKLFKERTTKVSKDFALQSLKNNEKMLEIINNIKELKILSAEEHFFEEFHNLQKSFNNTMLLNNFYCSISPYIIEIFIVLSLIILAAFIGFQNIENTSWMVASYAVMVAAIFRIAPALNRIQTSLNAINGSREIVKTMLKEFENTDMSILEQSSGSKIEFIQKIQLKNINFAYKKNPILKEINLEIKKGEFVGIVGLSGAGKSTLVDILMGLLPADSGDFLIDETKITQSNMNSARKIFGYVPQQINIVDGSILRNIAFGEKESEINKEKVVKILKETKIYDVIENDEQRLYSDIIRGMTGLSQGQKQRLAIARALYRDPEVLILDEATSSLDVQTENEITEVLNGFKGKKTIIAIAHRLSTLKSCDRLIYMKNGQIIDTGSFGELSEKYSDFAKLVKLSSLEK